jgi:GNAT superfamily N-acetyltransferase
MSAPHATAEVKRLVPDDARYQGLVQELVRVINRAYAVGEDGLWIDGTARTDVTEIAEAIRGGGMIAATVGGRLVGCGYVRPLDASTADLGLLAVAPESWGGGVGRVLVRSAEALMRSRHMTTLQLDLLVPKEWVHPEKQRLRAWYTRLGYRIVATAPFERMAAHLAPRLATPCEFLVFHKALTGASGPSPPTAASQPQVEA